MNGMIFWAIILCLAAVVTLLLVRAMRHGQQEAQPVAALDVQVYRDQLAEVERDVARGTLDAEDAERVRTEISRRILAADAAHAEARSPAPSSGSSVLGTLGLGAVLIAGSAALYWQLGAPGYGDLALADRIEMSETLAEARPDQLAAEARMESDASALTSSGGEPEYAALVDQLRKVVEARPDDQEGHRLLAISERNLGNFVKARVAYERYIDLRGDQATPVEYADLADFMILAAGGYVSPEAEEALTRALQGDPSNGASRYYWGLMKSQTGRPDQAFQIWDTLLRQGPADAPWIPAIQGQIDDIAIRAGITYSQPLPGGGRGPSAEDIEAAGELSASDRLEMIEGMVAGLAERLSSEGGPVADWARLITSLGVLGRREDAFIVFRNAQEVFADDPGAMDAIQRAGEQAGVSN